MHERDNFKVATRRGYRAIRLPYDVDALGMIIVLPDKIDGLAEIGGRIDAKELSAIRTGLDAEAPKLVELSLPRFKSAFAASLKAPFQQLGMALPSCRSPSIE
jgi:serine protease inhibitor